MKALRNWIEEKLGKRFISKFFVGYKSGRAVYELLFENGVSKDYFIDFDNQEIEEV